MMQTYPPWYDSALIDQYAKPQRDSLHDLLKKQIYRTLAEPQQIVETSLLKSLQYQVPINESSTRDLSSLQIKL